MKLTRKPSHAERGGFTLIELLVVIAIIGILVALTAAAVMRARSVGPKTTTRVEIGQLDGGVQAFLSNGGYGVDYVPSRIRLRKYLTDYNATDQLDQDSVAYLTTLFKGTAKSFRDKWADPTRGISWHSDWINLQFKDHPHELLEGDQCLVFFLGGIQASNPNGCLGFSSDSANPDSLGGNRKSFYEFKSNRLVAPKGKIFFSYEDAYGKKRPYAYFSFYGVENGYNKYYPNPAYKDSDCKSLGVWPYAEAKSPTVRYLKPKGYQIISAGANGIFGPGTDPTKPTPYYYTSATANSIGPAGDDDQANFVSNLLGAGE